ncbi:DctP family TRAP transporter solute-binding subunit [Murdochiella vaginalis]|uniref:DctP family TRAP transporter solute-binding subunit n=1 Tax=Murdochiella vaginalis TaxID=1852373 RepID=UPI0008FD9BBE|nr:DctP family TRAP transporter solute-binding subunit [Murdochiella vaginalis]
MKKRALLFLLTLCITVLTACGGKGANTPDASNAEKPTGETTKITVAIPDPQNSYIAAAAEEFKKRAEEYSNGSLSISIAPNGSLYGGDTAAGIKQLSAGSLDMLILATSVYSNFEPGFNVISVPYMFDDQKQLLSFLNSNIADGLFSRLENMNIKSVGRWTRSFRQITNSKRPITCAKDLEGLVLRVPNNSLYVEFFSSLGTVTTPMNFSEVYNALQLQTLDGQENPVDVPLSNNFYEVQKYISFTNHMADAWVVGINLDFYNKLTKEQQDAIAKAGDEVQQWNVDMMAERDGNALKQLEEKGMKSNVLTSEAAQELVDASKKLFPKFKELIKDDKLFEETIQFTGRNE